MSLGSTSPAWPESWDSAFKYAEDHDVVVVAAAGNRSGGMSQVGAPATIPGVLTVAGVDESGKARRTPPPRASRSGWPPRPSRWSAACPAVTMPAGPAPPAPRRSSPAWWR
ncbi:S8 family serine peptidase [Arthrobacter sp. JCM 19049]|uniref:S8 family serine peptidase n=1 Tax=Arthrobacter sp. JCM 19049 TaxID=1460643 RepID=UPI0035B5662F